LRTQEKETAESPTFHNGQLAFEQLAATLRAQIEAGLSAIVPSTPTLLYAPVRYMVDAGGKRVRPLLVGLAALASDASNESWLPSAIAVELLHTFTLVHDDIMDNADTRRGTPTVHIKFGRDAAILSGDVMIAVALEALARSKSNTRELLSEFALGFKRVCEGQALDKEFETRNDIRLVDYEEMILLKTASIIELAATLGAWSSGGKYVEELRAFARHTGMAFQVLDDLLDLTADHASFGKTIGGDILEGKRTFLYVEAMEHYPKLEPEAKALMDRIGNRLATTEDVVLAERLFEDIGILRETRRRIELETEKAQEALSAMPKGEHRDHLHRFSDYLLGRAT